MIIRLDYQETPALDMIRLDRGRAHSAPTAQHSTAHISILWIERAHYNRATEIQTRRMRTSRTGVRNHAADMFSI